MAMQDVIVVGGGIWGLSCAYACVKRGLSVLLLEADHIGCGASGGIVGALAPHTPDQWDQQKQFQFEALSVAGEFWAEVDAASGLPSGYGRIGRLVPLLNDRTRKLAEYRIHAAQELWQGRYDWLVLDRHELVAREASTHGLIYDTFSARLFPSLAVVSLASACRFAGVKIVEQSAVTQLDNHRVCGVWGESTAQTVIVAGGVAGFELLNSHLGGEVGTAVKGQAALLDVDLGDAPQIFADGVYVIPHATRTVSVGSTSEREWEKSERVDEKLEAVLETARRVCPALKGAEVTMRWAGLRPKARRRNPMLGPVPGLDGVFAAMGAFKIGFGIAHKVGELLADYAEGKVVVLPESFTVGHHLQ